MSMETLGMSPKTIMRCMQRAKKFDRMALNMQTPSARWSNSMINGVRMELTLTGSLGPGITPRETMFSMQKWISGGKL